MTTTLSLSPPTLASEQEVPSLSAVGGSLMGFLCLGATAAVGLSDLGAATRSVPAAALVGVGALLLTAPALLVTHQYLKLNAGPDALIGGLGRAWTRAGNLALGASPLMLFFSATSHMAVAVFTLLMMGTSLSGMAYATHALISAEDAIDQSTPTRLKMRALVTCWTGLTFLVGARLSWDVAHFIFST